MEVVLHKATTRGHANHGWLDSWHTFSFGSYHDPARMHFGALRVLNDDTVMGGAGFGRHSHDNMEIISIPLEGELEHADNMGNVQRIKKGDVQVMSAGTGIEHSEKNASPHLPVRFLQIWVIPNKQGVQPRYAQQSFSKAQLHNRLVTVISPMGSAEGVNIHQEAWFTLAHPEAGHALTYTLKSQNKGVYVFLIEGDIMVNNIVMNRRDGLGIYNENTLHISANKTAEILIMEVPV